MRIIKVCGITRLEDARIAALLGVEMIGLNFAQRSPRRVSPFVARRIAESLPDGVLPVGVFDHSTTDEIARIAEMSAIRVVQLHFPVSRSFVREIADRGLQVIQVFGWSDPESMKNAAQADVDQAASMVLVDAQRSGISGGTGMTWDWNLAAEIRWPKPWLLAGGLNDGNVAAAISQANPDGVDVAGGIESSPGIKDERKLNRFVEAVRNVG